MAFGKGAASVVPCGLAENVGVYLPLEAPLA